MGFRHPNHRLVKTHFSYTVEEVARLFGVHRNTVREWRRNGLRAIDRRRPLLIHGADLVSFLVARRKASKRPCRPGELYCAPCRDPRIPKGSAVVYQAQTSVLGSLVGICPVCDRRMFRRVNPAKLALAAGQLRVTMPNALEHIDESDQPSVNCDFKQDTYDHE